MSNFNAETSVWRRAWIETEQIAKSRSFWAIEVVVLAAVAWGTENPLYGAIAAFGLFAFVYLYQVIRAPIRQRDEARQELLRLQQGRKQVPEQLGKFIEKGMEIRLTLVDQYHAEEADSFLTTVTGWTEEAQSYLQENLPDWVGFFLVDSPGPHSLYAGNPRRSKMISHMDWRMERLAEILREVNRVDSQ